MNGYELTRKWFDYAFENKEAKVYHTALYTWIVELNNRLGWKQEFGLPTNDTMEGLSIGNKNTYLNTLRDLRDWGFIEIVQESKNQFKSCVIKLCRAENDTAQRTALDTALTQHDTRHCYDTVHDTVHGIDTIDKQRNKETKKQRNNKENLTKENSDLKNLLEEKEKKVAAKKEKEFDPFNALVELGVNEQIAKDYLTLRKEKRAGKLTLTALNGILNECEKNNFPVAEAIKISTENSWVGFRYEWYLNFKNKNYGKINDRTEKIRSELGANSKWNSNKYNIPSNDPRDIRNRINATGN